MLRLTTAARANGAKFEGVDLFLADPHTSIDSSRDDVQRLADKISGHGLAVGSVVAPVWPPVGGGSAMGSADERKQFLTMVDKACRIARQQLSDIGIRRSGVVRINSATGVHDWAAHPAGTRRRSPRPSARPATSPRGTASAWRPKAKFAGAECTAGSTWCELLEMVGRPKTLGFQADMAHTMLYTLGYNAPEHRVLPEGPRLEGRQDARHGPQGGCARASPVDDRLPRRPERRDRQRRRLARQDRTPLHGRRSERKARYHATRRLLAARRQGRALRKVLQAHLLGRVHVPELEADDKQKTWDDILGAMVAVREAHGWRR